MTNKLKGKIFIKLNLYKLISYFGFKVDWNYISRYQKLSLEFIDKHKYKVNWDNISKYQKLSEEFIDKHKDKVDWYYISIYQKISLEFIEKYKDKVYWPYISIYQKLSEEFIEKYKDKVNWVNISKYQQLSKEFIEKYKLIIDEDNWLYKSTEFKKNKVLNTGLYELNEYDYFVGYKGIRSDRYSKYNFQYQYQLNEVYECHSDYTSDENSFGLSVWDYKNAKGYCNELVVEVWFKPEDISRVVHKGGKIRVNKFLVKS